MSNPRIKLLWGFHLLLWSRWDRPNGAVTLSGNASSDVVVGLSSTASSIIRVHRAVIVPAGSSSATFEIDTYRSLVAKTVTIQATLNQVILTKKPDHHRQVAQIAHSPVLCKRCKAGFMPYE